MTWKKTKIKSASGRIVTVWKNEKGQISYSNPKAKGAVDKAALSLGSHLTGLKYTVPFIRSSLKIDPGSRPGQFLGGPLPKKIEAKSKQLLIDEEKEKYLNPQSYKQWSETEAGKAFIQKEAAIQEGLDEDARYTFRPNLENEKVTPISEEPTNKSSKSKAKGTSEKWTGEVGSRTLTKPTAIQKKLQKAGFKDEQLVKLMERYRNRYKNKRGW